jgi:hypothetical protein
MGCAHSGPYRHGQHAQYKTSSRALLEDNEPQIERGEARPILDSVGNIVGIPSKIMLWNRRVDNHDVSDETEAKLANYLAANELIDVKVRVNQYAPRAEWKRLVKNDAVGAGWRYTLGTLSLVKYTLIPGRIFGGDHYNPYTNSIHVYSDIPAIAIHEGGHAKDFAQRTYKGTYAAAYALIPGVPLYHEARATSDALAYMHEHETFDQEQEAYRTLYPAYGSYIGDTLGGIAIVPAGVAWGASVVGGHIVGRRKAREVPSFDMELVPHETYNAPASFESISPSTTASYEESHR